jgi:hypothetical protein
MKNNSTKYTILLSILLGLFACKSTKFIPEGEYLLDRVRIESDIPGYKSMELKPYVRQQPNYKMFGIYKTLLHVYSLSGRDSTRWHNRVIRKLGEEPVVFDTAMVDKTVSELRKLFVNMGYMDVDVSSDVLRRNKKARVTYRIRGNVPYYIQNFAVRVSDATLEAELFGKNGAPQQSLPGELPELLTSQVKEGMLFDRNELSNERDRLTTLLHNRGYFGFAKDNISYDADSTRNRHAIDLLLKVQLPDSVARAAARKFYYDRVFLYLDYDPLRMAGSGDYPVGNSLVYNNYTLYYLGKKPSMRFRTLLNNCFIAPHQPYSQLRESLTYASLSNLRSLSNIRIWYDEKVRNDSALLDCHILTMPASRQAFSYAIEGTNTTGDLGVATAVNYTHRNLFRGAEMFNFQVRTAYEAMNNFASPYWELGGEASIMTPKILFPFVRSDLLRHLKTATEFSVSYNYQTRPEYDRTLLSGNIRYRWQGRNRRAARQQFDILDVDYVYLPRTDADFMDRLPANAEYFGYTNQFIVGMGYSFYYSTSDAATVRKNDHSVRFSIESAGNLLLGLSSALRWQKDDLGMYRLLGTPFAQFIKGDFDFTKSFVIDNRNSIVWRIGGGIGYPYGNSKMLPFEKRYYSGGANSVRAWQVRQLGPGSYVPTPASTFFNQSGDIKFDLNIEYRTHFFWKLEAAAFIDAGNIWTIRPYEGQENGHFRLHTFYKEIALGYGLGIRLDFDYFLIRLDAGLKAYDPAKSGRDQWALFHPNRRGNIAWHVAIGYPF